MNLLVIPEYLGYWVKVNIEELIYLQEFVIRGGTGKEKQLIGMDIFLGYNEFK